MNNSICSYFQESDIKKYVKDLSELCGKSIKEINLEEQDPKNIFLKPFMKQNFIFVEEISD